MTPPSDPDDGPPAGTDPDSGSGDPDSADTPDADDREGDARHDRDTSADDGAEQASGSDTPPAGGSDDSETVLDRIAAHPMVVAVVGLTAIALAMRLVSLGARTAHWDEARVAYWTLYAHEQGSFAYRRIIHGPFVQHTSRWLFGVLGVSDFTIRLPVALVGGLLPLSALLFRKRLRRLEVIALAAFLSFNAVLLYFSRFMRSDVLVGAFMFTALGLTIRFLDTRKPRYFYGIAAFVVLGFASKENAVLYVVTWLGALGLLADRALDAPGDDVTGTDRIRRALRWLWSRDYTGLAVRYGPHAVGSAVLGAVLFVFMFAPRGAGLEGMLYPPASADASPGLWTAVGNPAAWPEVLGATVDQFIAEYGGWASSSTSLTLDSYITRLGGALKGLGTAAVVLSLFSVVGFVRERYGVATGRPLVMAVFFAGIASVVGYPLGLSITTGWRWNNVHILLQLAIPAAVGVALIARWGYEAFVDDDEIGAVLAALVLLVVAGAVALPVANLVYQNPTAGGDNVLVQHAQPNEDLQPLNEQFASVAEQNGEVMFYGNPDQSGSFVDAPTGGRINSYTNFKPVCTDWSQLLPINWYLVKNDANATCWTDSAALREKVAADPPAMIITKADDGSVPRAFLRQEYTETTYNLRSKDTAGPKATVYVRTASS